MGLKNWLMKIAIKKAIGGKMFKLLEGKKTYLTMAVVIILSLVETWNGFCGGLTEPAGWCINISIPTWVFTILGALGIYTRAVAKPK